ncbi:hypothetical protein ACIQUY_04830 [Streptomyces sp. NPDC090231]|uniref:hypothetical protein n=1 Tax=unclassified Streptomyces TaxID=2593676 RepID=UPI00382B664A
MSAREELFESLTPTYRAQYAPGEEDSVNALLDAYRDEVLHEAGAKLRAEVDEEAELFEELWSMQYRISGDKPGAKAFARVFLDRHARALAERIRTSDRLRDYTDDHMSDMNEAADEIDPDSYVNRCQGCGNSKDNGQAHGYGSEYGGCV